MIIVTPTKFTRTVLDGNPHVKCMVIRPRIVTPRKPNSARRPVIKGQVTNKRFVVAHIPGPGHNLRRYSNVLIAGVGARDLPGVYHTCVRGVYDFVGVVTKTKRRSVYATKRPESAFRKIRRKFRNLK